MTVFVVAEFDGSFVAGICTTRADAEELALATVEEWVYKVMMTEDPKEVTGYPNWDWHYDYYDLLLHGSCLTITEAILY